MTALSIIFLGFGVYLCLGIVFSIIRYMYKDKSKGEVIPDDNDHFMSM